MTKLHHATAKRATNLGVTLIDVPEGGFRVEHKGRLSEDAFDSAKEALDIFATGEMVFEARKGNFCGVMVASYHDRYEHNPHGPGCGDGLDCAMRDLFTDTDTGVDVKRLQACGERLELWNPAWETLNPGMKRMNLTNRIRAWLRNHNEPVVLEGTTKGRFGVAHNPAGKALRALKKAA